MLGSESHVEELAAPAAKKLKQDLSGKKTNVLTGGLTFTSLKPLDLSTCNKK